MSLPALRKFVLPPVIASAAIFSVMSSPLAVLGDKPVNIRLENEPVFDGRLRDIAPPYVGLVTLLSFGAGLAAVAVCGWRNSARRSEVLQHQITQLEGNLVEKDGLLRELQLSESRIQVSGLTGFLDDEVPFDRTIAHQNVTQPISQPVVAQTPTVIQPTVAANHLSSHNYQQGRSRASAAATSGYTPAQTFMRYAPSQMNPAPVGTTSQSTYRSVHGTSVSSEEFEELQQQMRLMMEKNATDAK